MAGPARRRTILLFAASLAGCSLIVPTMDELASGTRPLPGADASPADASADGALGEASKDGAPPEASTGGCPSGRGPNMIFVDGYCIDSTEVTAAQYLAFLEDKQGDTSGQPPRCEWNVSHKPSYDWPAPVEHLGFPVVGVDWCDAWAFCNWAGKRLCGAIAGGPVTGSSSATLDAQWYRACDRGDGLHAYPYGNTYDDSACNTEGPGRVESGSLPGCQGTKPPGIFDLSGNVWEWEDRCEDGGADAAGDPCQLRGGSFGNVNGDSSKCGSGFSDRRSYAVAQIGFRCCSR